MSQRRAPTLAIVTPCFNEHESINSNLSRITKVINDLIIASKISQDSYLCVVDDGSTDNSLQLLRRTARESRTLIYVIELSKNVGHQRALLSGLRWSTDRCECSISIDFDLQDDINCIPEMIAKYNSGAEIVLGVRNNRDTDKTFKRLSASIYYALAKKLGMSITPQHADFRLVSNTVLQRLADFNESNLYLRSVIPQLTRKIEYIYYRRAARTSGVSKYTLSKMVKLARQSIFAQSNALLIGIGAMIIIYTMISFSIIAWIITLLISGIALPGWASILATILITSTVTLIVQYMMAEHMTLMARDIKRRPEYLIESITCNKD